MKGILSAKRIVIAAVALGLVAIVVVRVIQASAPVQTTPDVEEIRRQTGVPVEIVEMTPAPFEARRPFTGTVRGIRSATVRARTGDEILEIPVNVGQRVREGEVVVRQSSHGSMASVNQAEAAFEQAQRAVERLRPLHEQGGVSDQDWDNALTGLRVAEANLDAARRNIVLTSPIDGVVTDILVNPGTFPGNGDPLVRISDLSRVQVVLQVSPEQRAELGTGQPAFLAQADAPGRITRIALQADPESRLIEVELTFPGSVASGGGTGAGGILPGSLTMVEVQVGTRDSALQVPRAALHGDAVWVVDGENLAHLRTVGLGLRSRDGVEVVEGLEPGDKVVTAGASLLSEGSLVRIVGG